MFASRIPLRVARDGNGNNRDLVQGATLENGRDTVVAYSASTGPTGTFGAGTGGLANPALGSTLLVGGVDITTPLLEKLPHPVACNMYEDIYLHDAICGTTVNIMANLPFSPFQLHIPAGKERKAIRDKFEENLDNLRINVLLPAIAREVLVFGAHVSLMILNFKDKVFTDTMPFPYSHCDITTAPVFGRDPIVRVNVPQYIKQFFSDKSPTVQRVQERLSPELIGLLRGTSIELDPLATVYIPNRSFSFTDAGTSLYQRVLPIYLLEKVLHRGTVTLANRRQSSVTHITASGEDWIPNQGDLDALVQQVIQANRDPIGAVIATNANVNISEYAMGGDFWRWDSVMGELGARKLIAMGSSEALLSGDASYCLAGDQLIQSEKGLIRIDEIVKPETRVQNKAHRINLTVGSRYGNQKAKKWLYNGYKKVYQVSTHYGNKLKATGNHKVLVLNPDLTLEWMRVDRLKAGDLLCNSIKPLTRKTKLPLNLSKSIKFEGKASASANVLTRPRYMTPELAYFLGALVAEGSYGKCKTQSGGLLHQIGLANTDRSILNHVKHCVKTVFNLEFNEYLTTPKGSTYRIFGKEGITNHDCYTLLVGSKQLVTWLEELGVSKKQSRYKRVPWSILQADEKSQLAFLAAYLDCDGSLRTEKGRAIWCSSSKKLLQEMQLMLQSHGVLSIINRNLHVNAGDMCDLYPKLKPYLKGDKLNEEVFNRCKARWTYGFSVKALFEEIETRKLGFDNRGMRYLDDDGNEVTVSGMRFTECENKVLHYDGYDDGTYDAWLAGLKIVSRSNYDKIMELLKHRYRFNRVTKIKDAGHTHVYDLSMDQRQEPAFVAQGLIVHNSNADAALNIMYEQLHAFRSNISNQLFYNRLFPFISLLHGFTKEEYGFDDSGMEEASSFKELAASNTTKFFKSELDYRAISEKSKLIIPELRWKKRLEPNGSEATMAAMEKLREMGAPFSLRAMCAAGGFDLDDLIAEAESAERDTKKLLRAREILLKQTVNADDSDAAEQASALSDLQTLGMIRSVPTLSRKFNELASEISEGTVTGKRVWVPHQHRRAREQDEALYKAAKKLEHERTGKTVSFPSKSKLSTKSALQPKSKGKRK